MRLFKNTGSSMQPIAQRRFAEDHYETHLEDWIFRNPELLGNDLMMLGRQVTTDEGKTIDLLAVDKDGNTVIIELKRGDAPSDLVTQILRYRIAIRNWKESELEEKTKRPARSLPKDFRQRFSCDPPDKFNSRQRTIVVVESIDDLNLKLLRDYDVEVLEFAYFENAENGEYVVVNPLMAPREVLNPLKGARPVRKISKNSSPIPSRVNLGMENFERIDKDHVKMTIKGCPLILSYRDLFSPIRTLRLFRASGTRIPFEKIKRSDWELFINSELDAAPDPIAARPTEAKVEENQVELDSCYEFVKDTLKKATPDKNLPVRVVRRAYDEWCQEKGEQDPMTPRKFNHQLVSYLRCERASVRLKGISTKVWKGVAWLAEKKAPGTF